MTDSSLTAGARRWLLLAACLTAVLIPLCFTGPAVVLPAISQALGGSAAELGWITNGYILAYGSAMMAAGSLADIHGRKRVWRVGLGLFAAVTLVIPLAPTVLVFDLLRVLQGLGGSAAFAGAMAALAQEFHGPIRTRVFSLLGTTFGLGLAFGPLLAGLLSDSLGWRMVFLLPALIGVAGALLVSICARESRDPNAQGLDWPGAISFTAMLTLFTCGTLLAPEHGWSHPLVQVSLWGSLALLVAFVVIERRVARPMLELGLFRRAQFAGVQLLGASPAFAFVVLIVLLPGRFIGADGLSAVQAGQLMIALSAPLLVVPMLAALLSRWFTAGLLSALGLALNALGLLWMSVALASGPQALLLPMLLVGVGIGLPWGLMDGLAVSVVEKERAGMATGIFNTVRVSGDGVAIALVGALLAALVVAALPASGASSAQVIGAAGHAAMGDLARAAALLGVDRAALQPGYDAAFRTLLQVLAAITGLTAMLVFMLLGKVRTHEVEALAEVPCEA